MLLHEPRPARCGAAWHGIDVDCFAERRAAGQAAQPQGLGYAGYAGYATRTRADAMAK